MSFPLSFGFITAFTLLLTLSLSQNTDILASPCLYNSTHCSCYRVASPGNCLRFLGGDSCQVDKCDSSGFTCDCSGTYVCQISTCQAFAPKSSVANHDLKPGKTVKCKMSNDFGTCIAKVEGKVAAITSQEKKDLGIVQFGQGSTSTVFNMSAFLDIGDFISNTYAMHGKWKEMDRLRRRYINIRIYESDVIDGFILCSVYNNHDYQDDGIGNMQVDVKITGASSQVLQWVACDDEGECYGNSQTTLIGRHSISSQYADGWCVKPLQRNGNVISVKFQYVSGMKGIAFQSATGTDQTFTFGEEDSNEMRGTVNKYGVVKNGVAPEILFNLHGIEKIYSLGNEV